MVSLSALLIFIAIFAIAAVRGVHVGVLTFAAACGVGVGLAVCSSIEDVSPFSTVGGDVSWSAPSSS